MLTSSEKLENLLGEVPRLDSQPFNSVLHREYSPEDIFMSITPANVLHALHRARYAREFAVSYRGFNVGAALFAFQQSPARVQIVTGANIKPEQNSTINIHAEQSALRKVARAGFNAVSIIAVVGETQNDQQSGHEMCTLHPCGLCRNVLQASPLINTTRTLIATALPDLRTIELSTVAKLGDYHENEDFAATTRIDVPDLQLLRPVEPQVLYKIDDSEQVIAEDEAWAALIDPHLFALRVGSEDPDKATP